MFNRLAVPLGVSYLAACVTAGDGEEDMRRCHPLERPADGACQPTEALAVSLVSDSPAAHICQFPVGGPEGYGEREIMSVGACTLYQDASTWRLAPVEDFGEISIDGINGASVSVSPPVEMDAECLVQETSSSDPSFPTPGQIDIEGTGGSDIGAFAVRFEAPPLVAQAVFPERTFAGEPAMLEWSYPGAVQTTVHGFGNGYYARCSVGENESAFSIPAAITENLGNGFGTAIEHFETKWIRSQAPQSWVRVTARAIARPDSVR